MGRPEAAARADGSAAGTVEASCASAAAASRSPARARAAALAMSSAAGGRLPLCRLPCPIRCQVLTCRQGSLLNAVLGELGMVQQGMRAGATSARGPCKHLQPLGRLQQVALLQSALPPSQHHRPAGLPPLAHCGQALALQWMRLDPLPLQAHLVALGTCWPAAAVAGSRQQTPAPAQPSLRPVPRDVKALGWGCRPQSNVDYGETTWFIKWRQCCFQRTVLCKEPVVISPSSMKESSPVNIVATDHSCTSRHLLRAASAMILAAAQAQWGAARRRPSLWMEIAHA